MERQEGAGFRRLLDTVRHAHSLGSLEMVGREAGRGGVHSQGAAHLPSRPGDTREDPGVGLGGGPPSPSQASVRVLDGGGPAGVQDVPSARPAGHSRTACPLRLSQSQPRSPPAASTPRTPRTPAAFSLDQAIFNLPQGASGLQQQPHRH
ncbi:unnamed protein product [Tetraodon nigroviridis]|uniref:(spotted green pufferfish) hypothetical protein n=1 Tax=Tetraodon nigroviridis TaxID=99883 RepID=Q4T277_TETNG|nr:unnamed protein product [Tetraodon nigroviridis]